MLKEKSVRKKRTSRKGRTSRKRRTSRKGRISSKRRTSRKRITSRKRTSRKRRTSRRKSKKYRSKGETNRRIKGRRTRKPPSLNQELLGGATREEVERKWNMEQLAKKTNPAGPVKKEFVPIEEPSDLPHTPGKRVTAHLPSFKKIVKLEKAAAPGKDTVAAMGKLKLKKEEYGGSPEAYWKKYVEKEHAAEHAKTEGRPSSHALKGAQLRADRMMEQHKDSVRRLEKEAADLAKKIPYKVSWEDGEEQKVKLEELKTRNGNNYDDLTPDEVNKLYNLDQFEESKFEVYVDDPVRTDCNIVAGYQPRYNTQWNYMVDCDPIINTTGKGIIKKGVKKVDNITVKDGGQENKWLERQKEGARLRKLRKRNLSKPDLSKLEEGTLILVDDVEGRRLGKYIKSESEGIFGSKKHYIHFLGSEEKVKINKPSNWSAEIDEIQNYVRKNASKLGEIENYRYVELE